MIQTLKDLMPRLMKLMPTLRSLKIDYGINPDNKEEDLTTDKEDVGMELYELLTIERKQFIQQKVKLQTNFPKICGLI